MSQQGFTILELMVTLAVAAIIISIAAPAFKSIITNNQVTTAANDFSTSLAFAKTEAVKRNRSVKLISNAGGWAQGYDIGIDGGVADDDFDDADDTLLKTITAVNNSVTVSTTPSPLNVIEFNALGGLNTTGTIVFDVPETDDATEIVCKRTITLNASGVFTMNKETQPCTS